MIKGYRFLEAWIPWDGCIGDMEFGNKRYEQFEEEDSERFAKEWPTLYQVDEYKQVWIYFRIDMTDGTVINWPAGEEGSFTTVKVCDGGKYRIADENNTTLGEYEGYVPELLSVKEKGYGDYLEFEINKDGKIPGWRVTDSLLEDFEDNM
jgi:hypothetical protein